MTPEQLKASILQYAVQGKLVEQRPEEGTAEEDVKQSESLKKKLNEGGILKGRKTKDLLPINSDIPFDIPYSWKWVRLGSLVEIFGRIGFRGYTKNDIVSKGEGAITMSPSNIIQSTGEFDFSDNTYLSWEKYEESPEIMLEIGDIVLVKTGSSYGKCGLIKELPEKATINPQLAILKYISCDNAYLNWVLKSPFSRVQYEEFVTGTSIPTFSQEKLANMLIPLPPLEEQHRIVAKIEQLLPYVDRYAASYEKLEQFNAKFPKDMKKSILQYAIQGKLVEQRPEEGTAEELYQQIQKEKEKLIKEKKIKKEKPLDAITEDEIPFDIPESWKWCYIGDLFLHNTGKAQNSSGSIDGTVRKFITTSNLYWNEFDFTKVKEMPFTEKELERCTVQKGDLLVCEGGDCGRSAVWNYDEEVCIQNHVHRLRPYQEMDIYYFYYIFYLYKTTGKLRGRGVAIQGLSNEAIHKVMVPLPPFEEQKRIVEKIEELLPYCDRLIK